MKKPMPAKKDMPMKEKDMMMKRKDMMMKDMPMMNDAKKGSKKR